MLPIFSIRDLSISIVIILNFLSNDSRIIRVSESGPVACFVSSGLFVFNFLIFFCFFWLWGFGFRVYFCFTFSIICNCLVKARHNVLDNKN